MEDWKLREKIIQFIRTWPILILVFIGSGVVSWSIVHFFPPAQLAVAEIYIGIDITRVYDVSSLSTYAKTEPFNVDDYKNWQLSQVEGIAFSELIADQSLAELRNLDSYWESVSTIEFLSMQDLDWYDVGVWRMKIQTPDKENALQGVQVWREKLLQELTRLIEESEDVLEFEGRMRATNEAITLLEIRVEELKILRENIDPLLDKFKNLDPEQVVDKLTRDELWSIFVGLAFDDFLWAQTLNDFPDQDQTQLMYTDWLERVLIIIDTDKEKTNQLLETLEGDLVLLTEDYIREINEAQGLSASLYVEELTSDPRMEPYYKDSVIGLAGSFLGLLIYIMIWVMISERKEK